MAQRRIYGRQTIITAESKHHDVPLSPLLSLPRGVYTQSPGMQFSNLGDEGNAMARCW